MTFAEPVIDAKAALDRLISIQRVHMYKPIQIAEILYRTRQGELTIEQLRNDLEAYRNPSKRWRDIVTRQLLEHVSTSSQKFQDNLFEANAISPSTLAVLAENNKSGVVERYIYYRFREKQKQIIAIRQILDEATKENFDLNTFLAIFVRQKGLKRSIDKLFEIVVYALFTTLVQHLKVTITVAAHPQEAQLLKEFEEFARLLIGIDSQNPTIQVPAKLYRAGATNAADRGLDMWANFGTAVQVKHISLKVTMAEDIVGGIAADDLVIVCKDNEKEIIERMSQQLGQRVRGIIVQSQLAEWYAHALRGDLATQLGTDLLQTLRREFQNEFPFSHTFEPFFEGRNYHQTDEPDSLFWIEG